MGATQSKPLLGVHKRSLQKVSEQKLHPKHDTGYQSELGVGQIREDARRIATKRGYGALHKHGSASLPPGSE